MKLLMHFRFKLKEYDIHTGNLEDSFPDWMNTKKYSKILILTDEHTNRHCLPVFLEKTRLKSYVTAEIPAGEIHKTLSTCESIWSNLFEAGLDRKSLVINLGGGVIGDMGGFCAATFKRGIDFVQVPTTLLSMTDAAVGGKLGIDFKNIKNAVGVFRNPAAVFCDTDFLKTLAPRELVSGYAEVIKHAMIGDPSLWGLLSTKYTLEGLDWPVILKKSLAVKVKVVKKDPFEKDLRQILNFGHTIGHAVESHYLSTEKPLTHGEAIAIGMISEWYLTYRESTYLDTLCTLVFKVFATGEVPEHLFPTVWELMSQDKKNASGKVRMALPEDGKYAMRIVEPSYQQVVEGLRYYNQKLVNKSIE